MSPRRPFSDEQNPDDWDGTDWSEEIYESDGPVTRPTGQGERIEDPVNVREGNLATSEDGYDELWMGISARYRTKKKFTCELCKANLRERTALLHTHHNNRDKMDNSEINLMAVCVLCHAEFEGHVHLLVGMKMEDVTYIESVRPKEQNKK